MSGLWLWVALFAVLLLALHWRYAHQARKTAEQQWRDVQNVLSQRHELLTEIVGRCDGPAPQIRTVETTLKRVRDRDDTRLKSLKQRCALEFRLAVEARKLLETAPPDNDRRDQLLKLDRGIQSALAIYDIAERSYNRRLEGFPGGIVGTLGGFRRAPRLDIEPVIGDDPDE